MCRQCKKKHHESFFLNLIRFGVFRFGQLLEYNHRWHIACAHTCSYLNEQSVNDKRNIYKSSIKLYDGFLFYLLAHSFRISSSFWLLKRSLFSSMYEKNFFCWSRCRFEIVGRKSTEIENILTTTTKKIYK